jgi:hypothetical protein
MPIKEEPSYTKPVGKPGDERQYTKKDRSVREHPHTNENYKKVGSGAKGDERKHPKGEKIDYSKFDREHPYKESGSGQGYGNVGKQAKTTKGDGSERQYKNKNSSPFRK